MIQIIRFGVRPRFLAGVFFLILHTLYAKACVNTSYKCVREDIYTACFDLNNYFFFA